MLLFNKLLLISVAAIFLFLGFVVLPEEILLQSCSEDLLFINIEEY
jgi:hypothetical protein